MNTLHFEDVETPPEHFETQPLIETLILRGWHWSDSHVDRLVDPRDNDIALQYDRINDRLTISPKLDAILKMIILTPPGKSKSYWRRTTH